MNPVPQVDNGLCEPRMAAWFREHLPEATQGFLEFERIAGGRSNLTYSVRDEAGSRWVLRRPPLGIRHASAHDVIREADILERLQNAPVPTPIVAGKCSDESVTGAPFFVMDFIDGAVLRDPEVVRAKIPYETRAGLAAELVRNLAALHSVNPREIGWSALADRTDYIDRQLNRWLRNWKSDRVRENLDLERTHAKLSRNVPPQRGSCVVHGDFRLDNCIVDADGAIAGILDWELATVGDPLADLGQLLVYWAEPDDEVCALENAPTRIEGFPSRDELLDVYTTAAQPASDLHIDFYVAFNWWKIACIVEGVYSRTLRGAMGEIERSAESFGAQADRLASQAWRIAQRI